MCPVMEYEARECEIESCGEENGCDCEADDVAGSY